jgi:hypothetical protein
MRPTISFIAMVSVCCSCALRPEVWRGQDITTFFAAAESRTEIYERFGQLGYDVSSERFRRLVREDTPTSMVVDLEGNKGDTRMPLCRLSFTFTSSGRLKTVGRSLLP